MEWTTKSSYGKVARRIFVLFVLCALLPLFASTLISFREVTRQLDHESRQALRQSAKSEGMAIYERLRLLDSDLVQMSTDFASNRGRPLSPAPVLTPDQLKLFRGIAVLGEDGLRPLFGQVDLPPAITDVQKRHLAAGNAVLLLSRCQAAGVCMYMARYLDTHDGHRGLLIGEADIEALLNADTLPGGTTLCVLGDAGEAISCPAQNARLAAMGQKNSSGDFEWQQRRQAYVAGYWKLFLRSTFQAPQWTVILSKPRFVTLAPSWDFLRTFTAMVLLTLLVVVLLTLVQIRRSMVPLKKLQSAMQQIADRHFETRVEITSDDEFEQLANGFNRMADDLGRQFRVMETVREVDRAVLSSLRREEIVKTVLERMRSFLPYQAIGITLLGEEGANHAETYAATAQGNNGKCVTSATLSSQEVQELRGAAALQLDSADSTRSYLAPLVERGIRTFLVLPIRREERLLGVLILGNATPVKESPDDRLYAVQLADRLAVALSNARLVEELANLDLGTLTALARAIDAKSQWTAGHSERVTRMAVEIGRELGLSDKELRILHRGGLLHDIGKIGTPPAILDKPAKLSDEEFRVMREHVSTGARILEPIPGFEELIPIVLEHHERFDGSGYPRGLAGENISLHGRIFAVADVYDALVSDRPYRPGWSMERVLPFIQEQAGSHFDPRVVQAFLAVIKRQMKATQTTEKVASAHAGGRHD